jgi:Domain of unknown function (DUF5916)
MSRRLFPLLVAAAVAAGPAAAAGQQSDASADGVSAPVLPETIVRDEEGRVTVRAVRLATSLKVDGALDEAIYSTVHPFSGFVQMEPQGGQPATEKTEIWILFDDDNVYVSMRAWESQPDRMIANEMRRDSNNIRQGDSLGFSFDTFLDKRNAVQFEVNVLGGRTDGQSTNERQYNSDWNPVWEVAPGRFEGGWSIEAAIPFKSLRYRPGQTQTWGFQARRTNKWKNEIAYLTRVPPALGMGRGDFSASLYATLVGLEAPTSGRAIEIKPYAITDLTTDRVVSPRRLNDPGADIGIDAKYGVTQNLTADLTVNTDFAQVEADEQQVNLTRFSLFFPEKRDFFLENLGTFTFGGVFGRASNAPTTGSAGAAGSGVGGDSGDTPIMFYSRRIGLSGTGEVPILAGGRLTGRVGRFSLGLLDIQTREHNGLDSTNFSVVRVKRDILRRSSIGAMFTGRSVTQTGSGTNELYGLDGTFAFFDNLAVNTFVAKTQTDGLKGDDVSYRMLFDYSGDRYGLQLDRLRVGDNFNPEVGFLRRDNIRKSFAQVRFSPRSRAIRSVRKFSWIAAMNYIEDGPGRLVTRIGDGEFAIELQNSDRFSVGVNDDYEYLTQPFPITPTVRIPVGAYDFTTGRVAYAFGQQRRLSGTVLLERGGFYDGDRTTVSVSRGRVNVTPRFSAEPSVSINRVDLPQGEFTSTVAATRATFTLTPLMFVSALIQYNSGANVVSGNVRLRWEYRPGSELFVVYNEERDTLAPSFPGLRNRALILKVNRLFRP